MLAAQKNRLSLYYLFEEIAKQKPTADCIWSREACYTWSQAYDRVNQWGQWFLSQGVQPKDLVAFYWLNSADFVLAWLGLWSIGAAPAMINYNLAGQPLLHCLNVVKVKLILVDEEPELKARIEEVRATIENEQRSKIVSVDANLLDEISSQKPERPDDAYRVEVKGNWPMCMIFTRYRTLSSCW